MMEGGLSSERTLRRLLSPILLKELRSMLRRRRFFLSHQISLALFATAILMGVMHFESRAGAEAVEVGQMLFVIFFVFQAAMVTFVIPSFSCTAILSEREGKSFDLLMTTNLTPREIVWGKFTASVLYTLIFLVSTVPMVGVSFLFGGIEASLLVLAYVFLLLYGGFLSMGALFFSALCRRTTSAIGLTYGTLLPLVGAGVYALSKTPFIGEPARLVSTLGKALASGDVFSRAAPWLFLFLSGFFFLFVCATNRIQPTFGNRATPLRVFAAVFLLLGSYILWADRVPLFPEVFPEAGIEPFRTLYQNWLLGVTGALLFFAGFFCTEPLAIPRRILLDLRTRRGTVALAAPFYPGAFRGARFVLFAYAAVLPVPFLVLFLVEGTRPFAVLGADPAGVLLLPLVLGGPLFAFACVGVLLSRLLRSPPARRALLFVLLIAVEGAPRLLQTAAAGAETPSVLSGAFLSPSRIAESVRLFGFGTTPPIVQANDRSLLWIGESAFPVHFAAFVFYSALGMAALLLAKGGVARVVGEERRDAV